MQNTDDDELRVSFLLQHWYSLNKRDLPWRETTDPYKIWVSEIILQQTRVNQGTGYYLRFVARFPDVSSLAAASETDVLKLWQGLGYYSRARNLHAAAKQIAERFNGEVPETYVGFLSLKGVGRYTAAAVASIAYGQPYAVVDGNVYRVLSRLFAIDAPINSGEGRKLFGETAQAILDPKHAATHNQAMMDLGATICTPKQPRCTDCPLQDVCLAYERKNAGEYPVKMRRNTVRNRYFHYFHIIGGGCTWLHKRTGNDIWKNLYEFPLIETGEPMDLAQLQQSEAFGRLSSQISGAQVSDVSYRTKHTLSHQCIHASVYRVEVFAKQPELPPPDLKIPENTLSEYPVSRLIHKYLETIKT